MKRLKLRRWVKVVMIILFVGLTLAGYKSIMNRKDIEESKLVQEYKLCLERNQMQRYYCSKKLGRTYQWLDKLMVKYGYEYETKGYDLYIVEAHK